MDNCSQMGGNGSDAPCSAVFYTLGPILVFDTILCYGPQLSQWVERRLNRYFFRQMRESPSLLLTEAKRKTYRAHFKDLKSMIDQLAEDDFNELYGEIFV